MWSWRHTAGRSLGRCCLVLWGVAIGARGATALEPPQAPPAERGPAVAASQRFSIHWRNTALADAARRLGETAGLVVFLDRRVDPGMRVALEVHDVSADEALNQLAEAQQLAVGRVGQLRYLGPPPTAERLGAMVAAHRDMLKDLARDERAELRRRASTEWPRLTEPRALVERVAGEAGWTLVDAERIPHDLWPAGRLPAMSLIERLTVLLAGFELSFRAHPDVRTIEIVPLETPAQLTRRYRLSTSQALTVDKLRQVLPEAHIRGTAGGVIVEAPPADHERLREILADVGGQPPPRPVQGTFEQRYTLKVAEQPIGPLLRQLADRLQFELALDDRLDDEALRARVTFTVQNARLEELLKAALGPVGWEFEVDAGVLHVRPDGQ